MWLKATQNHVIKTIWLYGYETSKVGQQPAKFGSHKHCGSGDVMILVCHLIKVYVTLWAGTHLGELLSCQVWWP